MLAGGELEGRHTYAEGIRQYSTCDEDSARASHLFQVLEVARYFRRRPDYQTALANEVPLKFRNFSVSVRSDHSVSTETLNEVWSYETPGNLVPKTNMSCALLRLHLLSFGCTRAPNCWACMISEQYVSDVRLGSSCEAYLEATVDAEQVLELDPSFDHKSFADDVLGSLHGDRHWASWPGRLGFHGRSGRSWF